MVGFIPDLNRIAGQGWKNDGDLIYLIGLKLSDQSASVTIGASEYLARVHKTSAGQPPRITFDLERQVQAACREGIRRGWIQSAHDSAEGGVAIALAESCISGDRGATITLSEMSSRIDHVLFAEGGARIIVSVKPEFQTDWETYLHAQLGHDWEKIGTVDGNSLTVSTQQVSLIDATIADMKSSWSTAIERRLEL
jgi:phosphoribosylformylglycinamidine synthase